MSVGELAMLTENSSGKESRKGRSDGRARSGSKRDVRLLVKLTMSEQS